MIVHVSQNSVVVQAGGNGTGGHTCEIALVGDRKLALAIAALLSRGTTTPIVETVHRGEIHRRFPHRIDSELVVA